MARPVLRREVTTDRGVPATQNVTCISKCFTLCFKMAFHRTGINEPKFQKIIIISIVYISLMRGMARAIFSSTHPVVVATDQRPPPGSRRATMIFQQLFDDHSSTFTYLLADEETRAAVLIDPVVGHEDRDLARVEALGLELKYVLDTHAHADHISAAGRLRARTGARSGMAERAGAHCVDLQLQHGSTLAFGRHALELRSTPGHTAGCVSYVLRDGAKTLVFTGDALLIGGSGRTDFQEGDARTLYRSIHEQLFSLPDDTVVYPGHDYHGRQSTTIGAEKRDNPRVNLGVSEDEFVEIMQALGLPEPRMINEAVPANLACGETL